MSMTMNLFDDAAPGPPAAEVSSSPSIIYRTPAASSKRPSSVFPGRGFGVMRRRMCITGEQPRGICGSALVPFPCLSRSHPPPIICSRKASQRHVYCKHYRRNSRIGQGYSRAALVLETQKSAMGGIVSTVRVQFVAPGTVSFDIKTDYNARIAYDPRTLPTQKAIVASTATSSALVE